MGTGGTTWDTAGTLTLGTGNSFAASGVSAGSDFPYNRVWWTYFAPADGTLTIDTFLTETLPAPPGENGDTVLYAYTQIAEPGSLNNPFVYYAKNDDTGGTVFSSMVMEVTEGSFYHILASTFSPDEGIVTYRLRAVFTPAPVFVDRHTDWLSSLRDQDDNQLIISDGVAFDGELQREHNHPDFQAEQPWYENVLDPHVTSRQGDWGIWEAFGTDGGPAGHPKGSGSGDPDADACAVAHAFNGDAGNPSTGLGQWWNTGTTDGTENSPGVCRVLGDGDATHGPSSAAIRTYSRTITNFFLADTIAFAEIIAARNLWVGAVLEGLKATRGGINYRVGVLDFPDPADDGVPADAIASGTLDIEWEPDSDLDLLGVEVAGDYGDRSSSGPEDDPTFQPTAIFSVNDSITPLHTVDSWGKGRPGTPDGSDRSHATFTFSLPATSIDWVPLDTITGWDTAQPLDGDTPDAVIATYLPDDVLPEFVLGTNSVYNDSYPAVRFTFRSPRYRWKWTEELIEPTRRLIPPRRGKPRHQTTTASRGAGGRDSVQDGPRGRGAVV